MSYSDMEHRFGFHTAATSDKQMEHTSVRNSCLGLATKFDEDLPDGREKALAITKLEEAMFWANAAVAREGSTRQGIVESGEVKNRGFNAH